MDSKPSDIWLANPAIPTKEEINRYVNGEMSDAEAHAFEKILAHSECLADAVEGLLVDKYRNEAAINEINNRIEGKPKGKVVPILNFTVLAIAASLFLILIVGILLFIFGNQLYTPPMASSEPFNHSRSVDSISIQQPPVSSQPQDALAYTPIKEDKSANTRLLRPTVDRLADNLPEAELKDEAGESSAKASKSVADEPFSGAMPAELANQAALDSAKWRMLASQMMAFNEGNILEEVVAVGYGVQKKRDVTGSSISVSEDKKEKSRKSEASSPAPKMEGKPVEIKHSVQMAEKLIDQKKYDEALTELDFVIQKNNVELETATWLKAACFLQIGKPLGAKSLLQQLVDAKGSFAERASDILKKFR